MREMVKRRGPGSGGPILRCGAASMGMREPLDDIGYGQERNDRDHERATFHLFAPSSPTRTVVAHSRFPARTQEEIKGRGTEKVPRSILFCRASTGLRKTSKIIIT